MEKKNIIVGLIALIVGVILGVFLANAERAQAPSVLEEGKIVSQEPVMGDVGVEVK